MAEETETEVAEEIVIETPQEEEAPKEEKVEASKEEKVEVQSEDKPEQPSQEDELDSYSKGVQNRIKKLTEKYRQEERDKAEALRVSQELLDENKKLKERVQALDTGYLSEYGTRLESQTDAAKRLYKEAYEAGDSDKMLEAQQLISTIAVEQQRYNTAKARAEQQAKVPVQQPEKQQQPAAAPQPTPDPRAQEWAEKNTWFGDDRVMTSAAFAIHQQLVEEEGFDPKSDEYYTEVDSRMRKEFPHKFQATKKSGGAQVAAAAASASRSTAKTGRRSVKLSHSQVAIAKKLGVPLEEYAKYVKE
jgi:hypothetical protein|tara:strand:+ start:688 stop:1599 length:912 start_codon:yes stop_codon:yes gene_type:complete